MVGGLSDLCATMVGLSRGLSHVVVNQEEVELCCMSRYTVDLKVRVIVARRLCEGSRSAGGRLEAQCVQRPGVCVMNSVHLPRVYHVPSL